MPCGILTRSICASPAGAGRRCRARSRNAAPFVRPDLAALEPAEHRRRTRRRPPRLANDSRARPSVSRSSVAAMSTLLPADFVPRIPDAVSRAALRIRRRSSVPRLPARRPRRPSIAPHADHFADDDRARRRRRSASTPRAEIGQRAAPCLARRRSRRRARPPPASPRSSPGRSAAPRSPRADASPISTTTVADCGARLSSTGSIRRLGVARDDHERRGACRDA